MKAIDQFSKAQRRNGDLAKHVTLSLILFYKSLLIIPIRCNQCMQSQLEETRDDDPPNPDAEDDEDSDDDEVGACTFIRCPLS